MTKTNLIDRAGNEILVGDKVLKPWGWFTWKGKQRTNLRIHTVNTVQEGNKITLRLGNCWNIWNGGDVLKLTEDDLDCYPVPEDRDFFIDDYGTPTVCTDQHLFDLSDDMWQAEMERRSKVLYEFMANSEQNDERSVATGDATSTTADNQNIHY